MTSVTRRPAALTAYLRRATWGLPRARQQELWDELEEHVLTRAEQLRCSGTSPQAALSQALAELGPPGRVALGMTQVYAMPKLLLAAGIFALGMSAALFAAAGGGHGVWLTVPIFQQPEVGQLCVADVAEAPTLTLPVISRKDGQICYRVGSGREFTPNLPLVSVPSAERVMGALGGSVKVQNNGEVELRRPGGGWSKVSFAFDDGKQKYILAVVLFDAIINTRGSVPDKSRILSS